MKPAPTGPLSAWSRLARAARPTAETSPVGAPFGFATRVAALGLAARPEGPSLVEVFSLRAVGLAGLVAVLSLALGLGDGLWFGSGDELLGLNDTVAVVLALAD